MKKENFEFRTVKRMVVTDHRLYCDVCNKEIPDKSWYYDIVTGHHDWGRDSIDSVNSFDACSEKCVKEKVDFYFDELVGKGCNTAYLTIDREFYNKKRCVEEEN